MELKEDVTLKERPLTQVVTQWNFVLKNTHVHSLHGNEYSLSNMQVLYSRSEYSLVYMSSESMMTWMRWREKFCSHLYQQRA